MSGPSEWWRAAGYWHRRDCGVFALWAHDVYGWEVEAACEHLAMGKAPDLATAKRAAEDALRRLLVEALEALGT